GMVRLSGTCSRISRSWRSRDPTTTIGWSRSTRRTTRRLRFRRRASVQGDCWQGITVFAAARALRAYLPLLPDLGIAQAQRLAILPLRAACAPVPRLAAERAPGPGHRHLRRTIVRL